MDHVLCKFTFHSFHSSIFLPNHTSIKLKCTKLLYQKNSVLYAVWNIDVSNMQVFLSKNLLGQFQHLPSNFWSVQNIAIQWDSKKETENKVWLQRRNLKTKKMEKWHLSCKFYGKYKNIKQNDFFLWDLGDSGTRRKEKCKGLCKENFEGDVLGSICYFSLK